MSFFLSRDDFYKIAKWVANCDVNPHIVNVIYTLLDDDRDGNLSIKEFVPVLFQWRKSRGFEQDTVHFIHRQLTI